MLNMHFVKFILLATMFLAPSLARKYEFQGINSSRNLSSAALKFHNKRRHPTIKLSENKYLPEFADRHEEHDNCMSLEELNLTSLEILKSKFQLEDMNVSMDEVVAGYDEVNGGAFSEPNVREKRSLQASSYSCTGKCCSSAGNTYDKTKSMLSRWLSNTMYNNSKVHIWTWERNSYWGPSNKNNTNWGSSLIANRNQSQKSAANSITIIRKSEVTVQLCVPGGGYIEALPTGIVHVNKRPKTGSVFTFIRVGTGHVRFKTIYNTFIVLGVDRKLYHWPAAIPGPWQTFLVYEVMAVPSFRGVNLGSWLFPEYWMTPSLWDNVPKLIDGHEFQIQSLKTRKWVVTTEGNTLVSASVPTSLQADQFVLRRVGTATGKVLIRNKNSGRYLTATSGGRQAFSTNATLFPGRKEEFRLHNYPGADLFMLQSPNGRFLRVVGDRLVFDVSPENVNLTSQTLWRSSPTVFRLSTLKVWRTPYQMCLGLGQAACTVRLRKHWRSYITEQDWQWISAQKLNAVRLPIGYWVAQGKNPDFPFPTGGYSYLDWAFKMAVKYNVRILVSMHSAPSSNNNLETRDGFYEFTNIPGTLTKMVNCISWVAKRYGSNPMFAGINVINEPYTPVAQDVLIKYYKQTVAQVRKYNKCAYVSYNIRYGTTPFEYSKYPDFPYQATNVIQDQHLYKVFDSQFSEKKPNEIARAVTSGDRGWLEYIEKGDHYLAMVGEFSNSLPVNPANESGYEPFAAAQMNTFGTYAQAGWFFWSYKVGFPYSGGWSFRYGVEQKYILKQFGLAW